MDKLTILHSVMDPVNKQQATPISGTNVIFFTMENNVGLT